MERLDEGFDRPLAVVAHPDDLEDGASSATARWSAAGEPGHAVAFEELLALSV